MKPRPSSTLLVGAAIVALHLGPSLPAVAVADVDGKSDLDVAMATYSSAPGLAWSANQGDGAIKAGAGS